MSPTPEPTTQVGVTLVLRNQRQRVEIAAEELQFDDVVKHADTFLNEQYATTTSNRVPRIWTLVYRDDEDDLVTVGNPREFAEAMHVFLRLLAPVTGPATEMGLLPEMVFFIVPKATIREQLAPVLDAAGKVARIAVDTTDNLRKSQYVGRGRESLAASAMHTRRALAFAGRGLARNLRRVSSAVGGVVTRRRSRNRVASNGPEGVLLAEDEAAVSSNDVEMDLEEDTSAAVTLEEEVPMLMAPPPVQHHTHHHRIWSVSDTETDSSDSEDQGQGYDVVASPARLEAIAFEDDDWLEGEHAAQIVAIREILPDLDIEFCIETLAKHDFQLDPALLELVDA